MSNPASFLQQHADWPAIHDFFSDVAGPLGWWVLLQVIVLFAGTRKGLRLAWYLGIAALTNSLLKWLWLEPRPYWADDSVVAQRTTTGFGMPSGHAQGATALWMGIWLLFRGRFWFSVALIFIVFTALSRVYYGVHSVAQVLVGIGFGIGITLLIAQILPILEHRLANGTRGQRITFSVVALVAAGFATTVVWYTTRDVVLPADWLVRAEAAHSALGNSEPLGALDGGSVALAGTFLTSLLAGFAVLACVACERGHRVARTLSARCYCLLFAVVVNSVVLLGLRALGESSGQLTGLLAVLWLLVQPLAALWLPLQLWGEPDA